MPLTPQPVSLFSLAGRRALVTGAGRGLGRSLALGLAQAGAQVIVTGRSQDSLEATVAEIQSLGVQAQYRILDQSRVEDIAPSLQDVGVVDILVNNAGTEEICPSDQVSPALWDRILDTNLKGAFFTTQALAHGMLARGRGSVINLCSLTSYIGVPTATAYGSSKTGLLGMTRALSSEWAGRGLRVNAIAPGYFRTDMTEVFYQNQAWEQAMLAKIPAGRFGRPEDLVGAVVFLASEASAYISGQCLGIDGGYLASV